MKLYEVTIRSRYYKLDTRKVRMWAESKADARNRLWAELNGDEYVYVKAVEIKA